MSKAPQILYVEDDHTLAFVTKDNLEQEGYQITHYEDGQIALSNFSAFDFDLCLLDVMLPKMDGFELAKRIREKNNDIPIIFLTAKSQQQDKIEGLLLGGDDYITKPFDIKELTLKMEVFLKRPKKAQPNQTSLISIGNFTLDWENYTIIHQSEEISLTKRECKLLHYFFNHPNKLLPREEILMQIWGDDSYFSGRSLDVYISKLRKILKRDQIPTIENLHGTGFRLNT